jgi:hypothetical protein
MTLEECQQTFSVLPAAGQARFLATLAFDLTVWTRSAYPELLTDTNQIIGRLRAGNELQHRVTGHLCHILNQNTKRYPDDVFVAILFDLARPAGCERELTQIFQELHAAMLSKRSKAGGKQVAEDSTAAAIVP